MAVLIGFFLLSIVFSFLCSVWEAVLLSVTPSYIKRKEQEDPDTGNLLASLKKDIDKPLSAILTLNTIAHTVGAIGVGAQAGKIFGTTKMNLLGLEISYESLVATVMTLAILFLSEIIPKTIGANNWKSLAPMTAKSLKILSWILYPFIWISSMITGFLKKDKKKSVFSKQDFSAMVDVVSESGDLSNEDHKLIKNLLQFDDLAVKDVMTPRTVMIMADESLSMAEFYKKNKVRSFSRIPLYQETKDEVTGILLKDHLLQHLLEGDDTAPLSSISREATFVPGSMTLRKVFETLNEKQEHLAIVVDEYGGVMGLVTLEDIIETLFGFEIVDETDAITDPQKFARQKWEARAKKLGLIE
jgi:CBS domain containing-hemolysin-like protein